MSSGHDRKQPPRRPANAPGMVRWYSPRLLLRMGARTAAATIVGRYSDNRPVQAALDPVGDDPLRGAHDYSSLGRGEDFWFDYVADIGDGWNATYAVASALGKPTLELDGTVTRRGRLLIMGGDEIYPAPSREEYDRRTLSAYETALPRGDVSDPPHLFALPGNHDWYDGLHTFINIFCQARRGPNGRPGRMIGGWQTRQTRSYFALKLPRNWWLCGFDVQLGDYIDAAQINFFDDIARTRMKRGDKIILCAAVPSWVLEAVRDPDATKNLRFAKQVLTRHGAQIALIVSGDLHHYSHYQEQNGEGPTMLTSGGGGAFLHPTHKLPGSLDVPWDDEPAETFTLKTRYPSRRRSYALSLRTLAFAFFNLDFALMMGLFYTVLAWFLETRSLDGGAVLRESFLKIFTYHGSVAAFWDALGDAAWRFASTVPESPEFAIFVLAGLAASIGLNMARQPVLKYGLGTLHWMAHMLALFIAYCIAVQMTAWIEPIIAANSLVFAVWLALMIVVGGLMGGLVFGLYLLVALNIFGLQWTNSFSAIRIGDYKNFLRFRIDDTGTLTVFAAKIDHVPAWRGGGPLDPPSRAEAIEPSFTIAGKKKTG